MVRGGLLVFCIQRAYTGVGVQTLYDFNVGDSIPFFFDDWVSNMIGNMFAQVEHSSQLM